MFFCVSELTANIFKRGFLSDGGTTQRFSQPVLEWMVDPVYGSPKREIRKMAAEIKRTRISNSYS